MRSTTRLATVAAAAAALLLGSAAVASAQSTTIDDKRYDVLVQSTGTLASKGTYAQRVASSNADVDKIAVNHGTGFVSVRVTMHKLVVDEDSYTYSAIKTNTGDAVDFELQVQPDGRGGIAGVVQGDGGYCATDGLGLTGSSKTGVNGFVLVYIPRSCLANPTSVRVGGFGYFADFASSSSATAPTNRNYIDPISSRSVQGREYTKTLARG